MTMITLRARCSDNIDKRQNRTFVDVTGSGSQIPLQEENWLKRWCSLPMQEKYIKELYEFQVRDDDVYVVTFPKCGTTWIQEATWLLVNDLNFTKAHEEVLHSRSVFLDLTALYTHMSRSTIELANSATSPRVLKSHLPAHLLPQQIWHKKCKVVYCARSPKDMAVSYYHFHRGLGTWHGNISEFLEDLINNDIMYSPYCEHIMDFWQMRQEENIFFTTYEDMKRNLRGVLIQLNRFLERPELNEEQLQQLEKHLSFENMKANKQVNPTFEIKSGHSSQNVRPDFEFMRRGIVGSHKDELTAENQKKLDAWIAEHLERFKIKLETIFGEDTFP